MLNLNSAYAADEPEGSRSPGSNYVNRATFLKLMAGVLLLFAILVPVYIKLKDESEVARCSLNLKNQWDALQLYAVNNDERMPPAFYPDGNGSPVHVNGHPLTWASIVKPLMKDKISYKCPTAPETECSQIGGTKEKINLSYGMYAAMSMRINSDIRNPSVSILLAETSSNGTGNTFNPVPFLDEAGKAIVDDGFLIGYDSGNVPDSDTFRAAKYVTRLAFPDTKSGNFKYEGGSRHRKGVQAITFDGAKTWLTPDQAEVERRSKADSDLTGRWATR